MCLAVPGRVEHIDIEAQKAQIDYSGLKKQASTMLCPQTKAGDYVLVHAGFIIQVLEQEYGEELTRLTEELRANVAED